MQVRAVAKNVRVSPPKVRLVVAQIKKMEPREAIRILDFVPKAASMPLQKVIKSAVANAKNNYNLSQDQLRFAEIQVNHGQVFKRYRPISRGRAHSILKRTSNIRVVLEGSEKKKIATAEDTEKKTENTEVKSDKPTVSSVIARKV